MNSAEPTRRFRYISYNFELKHADRVCITGQFIALDETEMYKLNVVDKINKAITSLRLWQVRHLTPKGRMMIFKTFALSQLVFALRSNKIAKKDMHVLHICLE